MLMYEALLARVTFQKACCSSRSSSLSRPASPSSSASSCGLPYTLQQRGWEKSHGCDSQVDCCQQCPLVFHHAGLAPSHLSCPAALPTATQLCRRALPPPALPVLVLEVEGVGGRPGGLGGGGDVAQQQAAVPLADVVARGEDLAWDEGAWGRPEGFDSSVVTHGGAGQQVSEAEVGVAGGLPDFPAPKRTPHPPACSSTRARAG